MVTAKLPPEAIVRGPDRKIRSTDKNLHSKEKVSERPIKVRRSLAFLAKSIDPTENMY